MLREKPFKPFDDLKNRSYESKEIQKLIKTISGPDNRMSENERNKLISMLDSVLNFRAQTNNRLDGKNKVQYEQALQGVLTRLYAFQKQHVDTRDQEIFDAAVKYCEHSLQKRIDHLNDKSKGNVSISFRELSKSVQEKIKTPKQQQAQDQDQIKVNIFNSSEIKRGPLIGEGGFGLAFLCTVRGELLKQLEAEGLIDANQVENVGGVRTGKIVIKTLLEPENLALLIEEGQMNEEIRAKFMEERQKNPGLMAPCNLATYKKDETGNHFIFSKYAPNKDFNSYLRGMTLDDKSNLVTIVMESFKTILAQMKRFHEQGLVHKDLALRNLLTGADGKPIINDLGLAKRMNESGYAYDDSPTGPIKWMAKDALLTRNFDAGTDLFSLQITMIEILHAIAQLTTDFLFYDGRADSIGYLTAHVRDGDQSLLKELFNNVERMIEKKFNNPLDEKGQKKDDARIVTEKAIYQQLKDLMDAYKPLITYANDGATPQAKIEAAEKALENGEKKLRSKYQTALTSDKQLKENASAVQSFSPAVKKETYTPFDPSKLRAASSPEPVPSANTWVQASVKKEEIPSKSNRSNYGDVDLTTKQQEKKQPPLTSTNKIGTTLSGNSDASPKATKVEPASKRNSMQVDNQVSSANSVKGKAQWFEQKMQGQSQPVSKSNHGTFATKPRGATTSSDGPVQVKNRSNTK